MKIMPYYRRIQLVAILLIQGEICIVCTHTDYILASDNVCWNFLALLMAIAR